MVCRQSRNFLFLNTDLTPIGAVVVHAVLTSALCNSKSAGYPSSLSSQKCVFMRANTDGATPSPVNDHKVTRAYIVTAAGLDTPLCY